jgi:hypothetical protein
MCNFMRVPRKYRRTELPGYRILHEVIRKS